MVVFVLMMNYDYDNKHVVGNEHSINDLNGYQKHWLEVEAIDDWKPHLERLRGVA
jgi:hypothetical protein